MLWLNYSAPCLIPSAVQDAQFQTLAWALHDNVHSMALVLEPNFTYNKGKLRLEQSKIIEQLTQGHHNLDWQFSIVFKERTDDGD